MINYSTEMRNYIVNGRANDRRIFDFDNANLYINYQLIRYPGTIDFFFYILQRTPRNVESWKRRVPLFHARTVN